MSYYTSKMLNLSLGDGVAAVTEALANHGFGVLSDIDVQATMKKKLGADIPGYRILGACNPKMALRALTAENKIGTMLPCNVIVREAGDGQIEIAAVDPLASMQAVDNPGLADIAGEVQGMLREVIAEVGAAG